MGIKRFVLLGALVIGLTGTAWATNGNAGQAALMGQTESLSTANAGCYIDTPAYDHATPLRCFALLNKSSATAVFEILGIDWAANPNRYTVSYSSCEQRYNTTNEGPACLHTVHAYQSFTEHATVTDTWTGNTKTTQAVATYEYNR